MIKIIMIINDKKKNPFHSLLNKVYKNSATFNNKQQY